MKNTSAVVMAFVFALSVAGCQGGEKGPAGGDSTASAPGSDSTHAPAVRVLPRAVEQAEVEAEDIQADIDQGAWPAAEVRFDALRSLGDSLHAQGVEASKRSAYGSALDTLHAVVLARSKSFALSAANRVSRIVASMMADYPTKVPVSVTYMDVAGRDVLYAAQQGWWSDASNAALEMERNYAAVQTQLEARDSVLERRVTSEIKQLQDAVGSRSRGGAARLAQALLDDVDLIEQTF